MRSGATSPPGGGAAPIDRLEEGVSSKLSREYGGHVRDRLRPKRPGNKGRAPGRKSPFSTEEAALIREWLKTQSVEGSTALEAFLRRGREDRSPRMASAPADSGAARSRALQRGRRHRVALFQPPCAQDRGCPQPLGRGFRRIPDSVAKDPPLRRRHAQRKIESEFTASGDVWRRLPQTKGGTQLAPN